MESRSNYAKPANKTRVHVTDADGQKILVQELGGGAEYPILLFKQGPQDDFWQIRPGVSGGSIDYFFVDAPQTTIAYRLRAACQNAQGKPCGFSWHIQGSADGKEWKDLSSQTWNALAGDLQGASFDLPGNSLFQYLRFVFQKQNTDDLLIVRALQLYSF